MNIEHDERKLQDIVESEQPKLIQKFKDDYNKAARIYVPGYSGGVSHKIAAEIIRRGWFKQ
jgi:hypothetical protein